MEVEATQASSTSLIGSSSSAQQLSDQFLHLLVAQLKNQDPLNPVTNEDFISELAQLQSLDSSLKIAETNQSLLLQTSLATGSSIIGSQVTGVITEGEDSREVSGVVTSVRVVDGQVNYRLSTEDGTVEDLLPQNITHIAGPVQSIVAPGTSEDDK